MLADGPRPDVIHYSSCISNGFRFRIRSSDANKRTQNCGVVVRAEVNSYASAKDKNPRAGSVNYHGVVVEIFQLTYSKDVKFLLMKCDWVDINRGNMVDEFGFTLVNFNHLMYQDNLATNEPFVLAEQAEQVWYLDDPLSPDWKVVMPMPRRDHYDYYSAVVEPEELNRQQLDEAIPSRDEDVGWVRQDIDDIEVSDEDVDDCMDDADEDDA